MFKKFFIKLKPFLIKVLKDIEKIEQTSQLSSRVKIIKEKFSLPLWIFIVLFLFILILKIYFKIIMNELSLYYENIFLSLFLRTILILILFYVVRYIYKYFIEKIKIIFSLQLDQYKNDLFVFWTLVFLNLFFLILFKLNKINFYLFPLAGFAVLSGLLVGLWWSVILCFFISIISSFFYHSSSYDMFSGFLFYFLSSLYVIINVEKIFSRKDFIPLIIKTTFVNFLISSSLVIIFSNNLNNFFSFDKFSFFSNSNSVFSLALYNLTSGFLSLLIVSFLSSPLEVIYKRTTNIKLVELANFNNPLLKNLLTEAPGTYHHSVMVSSLAENVATNLGFNSLLCKVAGYYHDIGKIKNPHYFIENQVAIKNPHSTINTSLSALVIVNHVKEGVKLAEENKLDNAIIDIIQQHHGNSVIYGLYDKTLDLGLFEKDILRYPGPKPQTKEAALIMICDSCEAACRSIAEPDAQKIKETVERVINLKFIEGQFDEVPLTLRDLYKISNIITQMLISFYHLRTYRAEEK